MALQITFSGQIVDENNNPIEGASVYLPNVLLDFYNTPVGVATDKNGNFKISNQYLSNNALVIVSHVGYETVNSTVGSMNNTVTRLMINENELPEYVGTASAKKDGCGWFCWLLLIAGVYGVSKVVSKPKVKKVTL